MKNPIKSIIKWSLGLVSLLAAAAVFFLFNPGLLPAQDPNAPVDHIQTQEQERLEPGDILLHRGLGLAADMIVLSMNEKAAFTHCALVLSTDPVILAHSLSSSLGTFDGVQTVGIEYFNKKSAPNSVVALRPKYAGEQREKALAQSRFYVEKKVPFNNLYDLSVKDKLYCSQFLTQVLQDSGFWPQGRSFTMAGPVLSFSNFLSGKEFQVIFSHHPQVGTTLN